MVESTIITNIILGIVQGLTEFLPISSSGHLILVRELLGTGGALDLTFDAFLHFATAGAVLVYFWKDIWQLIKAVLRLPKKVLQKVFLDEQESMAVALIVGTIPAVILGLLLEDIMATAFRNPLLVAGALIVGSIIMLVAERHTANVQGAALDIWDGTSWKRGLAIGLFQSLALIPGMSRSGMTISGGMFFGISRATAAKFSFLLGIPLFLGAGVKQALEIGLGEITTAVLIGTATAFIVALLVIHYLLKFLRNNTLHIFIWYRLLLAFGIVIAVLIF